MTQQVSVRILAVALVFAALACKSDPDPTTEVRLSIASETPVDRLEILVRNESYLWDRLEQQVAKDITVDPFVLQLTPGRIDGEFLVYIRGFLNEVYVAGQSRVVAYERNTVVEVEVLLSQDFVSTDADEDGFVRCQAGSVVNGCDCDDRDSLVNPFTAEICGDDVDNDCSGGYPPDGSGCPCTEDIPCTNLDEEFVASAGIGACTLGVLRCLDGVLSDTCEGASPIRNPGDEAEVPNNFIDDDCDGVVDEGAPCELADFPEGRVCHRGFVDDPGNEEVAGIFSELLSGIEMAGNQASFLAKGVCAPGGSAPGRQSCDPETGTWSVDCVGDVLPQRPPLPSELDGLEPGQSVDPKSFTGVGFVELRLSGIVDLDGNPIDQCDGQDNNCDGSFDEAPAFDSDNDGFTRCGTPVEFIPGETDNDPPIAVRTVPGLLDEAIDCNDSSAEINPSAREVCGDVLDNDCLCDHGEGLGLPRFRVDGEFNCTAVDASLDCLRSGPRSDPTTPGVCGDVDDQPAYYHGYADNAAGELACYFSVVQYGVSCSEEGGCGTKEIDCCENPGPRPDESRIASVRPLCGVGAEGSCECAEPPRWDAVADGEDPFGDCPGISCSEFYWGIEDNQCFVVRDATSAEVGCAELPFCDGSNGGECCDPDDPASCCQSAEAVCREFVPVNNSPSTLAASQSTKGAAASRPICSFAAGGCSGSTAPINNPQGTGVDFFEECNDSFACSDESDEPYYAEIASDDGLARCYLRANVLNSACNGNGACQSRAEACTAQVERGPAVQRIGSRVCKIPTTGCSGTTAPVYTQNVENFTDPYNDCPGGNCCDGGCCRAQGQTCGSGIGSCDAGLTCVDGVCCDRACDSPCEACTAALTAEANDGTCSAINVVQTDSSPVDLCVAAGGCSNPPCTCDGDVNGDRVGECVSDAGVVCASDSDCATGNCVDGFCCDSECTGRCEACSTLLTGLSNGTCAPINDTTPPFTEDSFPSNRCEGNSGCGSGGLDCACVFDGSASSCLRGQGSPCDSANQCQSGFCVDGFCCESACDGSTDSTRCHACAASLSTSTANGICAPLNAGGVDVADSEAGTLETVCGGATGCGDADCICRAAAGECVSTTGACTDDSDCAGRSCSTDDGICCDSPCNGVCESCLFALTGVADGTCAPINQVVPDASRCSGTTGCGAGENCVCDGESSPTCKADIGAPCGVVDSLCASGHCVDGVCCESSCDGSCFSCNGADTGVSSGLCRGIDTVGAEDLNAATPCAGDEACNGRSSNPLCLTDIGRTCSEDSECRPGTTAEFAGRDFGFCVDGRCCNGLCDGPCEACNRGATGESNGVCSPRNSSGTDDDGAASSASTTCGGTVGCVLGQDCECLGDGSTNQCLSEDGAACTNGTQCLSGNCIDGYCCNSTCDDSCAACDINPGVCELRNSGDAGDPSCSDDLLCDGGNTACPANCAGNDGLCASGSYCCMSDDECAVDGDPVDSCVSERSLGVECSRDNECSSGHCVEGVCCDAECGGQCESCLAAFTSASTDGSCQPILDGEEGLGGECSGNIRCDGTSTTCPSTCVADGDCDPTYSCDGSGACVLGSNLPDGSSCASGAQCTSGFCTDGVCCDSECDQACESCGGGTCTPLASGTEDPSGLCNGYLCDSGGVCFTDCETNDDDKCAADRFCDDSFGPDQCVPLGMFGDSCEFDTDCEPGLTCESGFCN